MRSRSIVDPRVLLDDRRQRAADWQRTSKRRSSRPSSRPSAARCDTHTENTRASRRRTAKSWFGSMQRVDELADALLRDLSAARTSRARRPVPRRAAGSRAARAIGGSPSWRDSTATTRRGRASAAAECPASRGSSVAARRVLRRRRVRVRRPPPAAQDRAHQRPRRAAVVGRRRRRRPIARLLDQAVLERADVAAIQAARGEDRDRRAGHGQREDRRRLRGGRSTMHQRGPAAADRVAQSIECHVDERLRRALLVGRNRRVEELVPGAEQRAAEDRLAAARQDQAAEPRRDQAPRGCRPAAPPTACSPSTPGRSARASTRLDEVCRTNVMRLVAA